MSHHTHKIHIHLSPPMLVDTRVWSNAPLPLEEEPYYPSPSLSHASRSRLNERRAPPRTLKNTTVVRNTSLAFVIFILLSLSLPPFLFVTGQTCSPAPPLPAVVKVAILVFCAGPIGILDKNPNFVEECEHERTTIGEAAKTMQFGQETHTGRGCADGCALGQ